MLFKKLAIVLAFLLPTAILGQNLVPNASFECGVDRCDPIFISTQFAQHVCAWSCPNTGTADIFSTEIESKECYASMPSFNNNYNYYIGNIEPRTGKRHAGIFAYSGNYQDVCYREYLQTKLTEPIKQGESYCAQVYVSKAQGAYFASDGLGFYFSSTGVIQNNYANLGFIPQIVSDQMLADTAKWIKVGGLFTAANNADYLIFGNFGDDSQTNATGTRSIPGHYYQYGYYFVDDFKVERMPKELFTFTGESTICKGDSVLIFADVGTNNVMWTSLPDTSNVVSSGPMLRDRPLSTTYYRVVATGCDRKIIDTLKVEVNAVPDVSIGSDTTICIGNFMTLDAGPNLTYEWQDNSQERYFKVSDAGKYWVKVSNKLGCLAFDTVSVLTNSTHKFSLGKDTLMCSNIFFELNAGSGGEHYNWSSGSTDSVYTPTAPGQYWVMVSNQCGESSDSISIMSLKDLLIPNVLTVNDDDLLNRYFSIDGLEMLSNTKLFIYNRWGEVVYFGTDYKNTWPENSNQISSDTYYYLLEYPMCPPRKGWLHIIK